MFLIAFRITEAVFACLCKITKILNESKPVDENNFQHVFEELFPNRELWLAILDACPPWKKFEHISQLKVLSKSINLLEKTLIAKSIKIKVLRGIHQYPENVALLSKIHEFFVENVEEKSKNKLEDHLEVCSIQDNDAFAKLDPLILSIGFVKRTLGEIVEISDVDDILNDIKDETEDV